MFFSKYAQTLYVAVILVVATFGICPEVVAAEDSAFTVIVDPEYRRPLWRRTPPKDRNGEMPREVLERFLEDISSGDFTAAAKQSYFGWREGDGVPDPASWHTIQGKEVAAICRSLREGVTQVTLSDSTIKGKSGYWLIWYKFKNKAGNEDDFYVHLLRVDDVWKIRETSIDAFTTRLENLRKSNKAEPR